jgi:hypothetical protein
MPECVSATSTRRSVAVREPHPSAIRTRNIRKDRFSVRLGAPVDLPARCSTENVNAHRQRTRSSLGYDDP